MAATAKCPVCGESVRGRHTGVAPAAFTSGKMMAPSVPIHEYCCTECGAAWDDLSPEQELEGLRQKAAAEAAIQIEELDPLGLDARVWLYKICGPGGRLFTYRIEVARTALGSQPPAGFAGDQARLSSALDQKTRVTIAQGLHEDLVITASTKGWTLRAAPEPLRKFSSS